MTAITARYCANARRTSASYSWGDFTDRIPSSIGVSVQRYNLVILQGINAERESPLRWLDFTLKRLFNICVDTFEADLANSFGQPQRERARLAEQTRMILFGLILAQIAFDVWAVDDWRTRQEWHTNTAAGGVICRTEIHSGRVQLFNPSTQQWQELGDPGNPSR